jgi:predicted exporter
MIMLSRTLQVLGAVFTGTHPSRSTPLNKGVKESGSELVSAHPENRRMAVRKAIGVEQVRIFCTVYAKVPQCNLQALDSLVEMAQRIHMLKLRFCGAVDC